MFQSTTATLSKTVGVFRNNLRASSTTNFHFSLFKAHNRANKLTMNIEGSRILEAILLAVLLFISETQMQMWLLSYLQQQVPLREASGVHAAAIVSTRSRTHQTGFAEPGGRCRESKKQEILFNRQSSKSNTRLLDDKISILSGFMTENFSISLVFPSLLWQHNRFI